VSIPVQVAEKPCIASLMENKVNWLLWIYTKVN
jgi:hypothetical protein